MLEIYKNNLRDGIYIPSIEACWLYKFNTELGNYEVKKEYLEKLLNGKLDFSFELCKNKELIEGIEIKELNGKSYTLDIVNVKYKKKYKDLDNKDKEAGLNSEQLRNWSYENGFTFNSKVFSNWKRGSGSSRQGKNLFLINDLRDKCLDWARMGLKFTDNVSIASVRAYESLTLSSIIDDLIEIDPNHILVIDDYKSKFPWTMSKTWLENGKLQTETMLTTEKNSIWDGEGLLSNEIFEKYDFLKGKGVALLRNRLLKCAGFCSYLEKFYRKYCNDNGYNYDTYEVEDLYHNKIKVKDIELITTPSSIKIEKFNKEVLKEFPEYTKYGEGAWLKFWKDNCGNEFSVCKVDKPSHLCKKDEEGNIIMYRNRLSYQMVNTIPFTPDEIKQLVAPEIEYIQKLKTDLDFFLQEVNQEEVLELEDDPNEEDNDNILEIGSNIDVTSAFVQMVKKNPEFEKTQVFKDYRRNFIDAYITEMRKGKIRIDNADYAIACGNPIEMLKATVGKFDGASELKDNQLYCSRFKDGEDIIGFRSPSVNTGNIGIQVCKYVQSLVDYMNCTSNIVFLNSIGYPILSTYQGEDFDIDSNLLTNCDTITKACKRIDKENITPIPVNAIENTGSNDMELTPENMAKVDHIISQNYIGSVINLSQELNSLWNHLRYTGKGTDKQLADIYKMTSKLSSMSCVEIDKAKKQFPDLNIPAELAKMKAGFRLVDDEKIKVKKKEIENAKDELNAVTKTVNDYRKEQRKPDNSRIREIEKALRINYQPKLSDDVVLTLQQEVTELEALQEILDNKTEDEKIELADEIKEVKTKLREKRKILREDSIPKLSEEEIEELNKENLDLQNEILKINSEKQDDIDKVKNVIKDLRKELKPYDSRRVKPYFFKYIGDNEAIKQRKKTNKKHRKELDKPIIDQYAKDHNKEVKDVDLKDKELKKLLKVNDSIQKEWVNRIYDYSIETPMNWLNKELDKVSNSKKVGTVQVIQLLKKNKHKANDKIVNEIVEIIKNADEEIKSYKNNKELSAKDRLQNIRHIKYRTRNVILRYKLTKTNLYWVLKACLNSTKNNGKLDAKSSIESITLEILFMTFGIGLIDMFC